MLITDQVATAPCTDCIQARFPTFEAKQPGSVYVTENRFSVYISDIYIPT